MKTGIARLVNNLCLDFFVFVRETTICRFRFKTAIIVVEAFILALNQLSKFKDRNILVGLWAEILGQTFYGGCVCRSRAG